MTALWGVDHARSLAIVQPSLLRNQLSVKRAKLEQMGVNVFGLTLGDDLAERTIDAIEGFYHSLDVDTQFSGYESTKSEAVDAVIKQLSEHGMVKLGELQQIGLKESQQIIEQAIA